MKAIITNVKKESERIVVFVRFEGVEVQEKHFSFEPENAQEDIILAQINEEKNRIQSIEQKADELQSLINLEVI